MRILRVDVEKATQIVVNAYPGLTGPGALLQNGVHLSEQRSPASGAVAILSVTDRGLGSDVADRATLTFRVSAVGDRGGRAQSERAAEALALVLPRIVNEVAVLPDGRTIKVCGFADIAGPTETGLVRGQSFYTVSAVGVMQPAGALLI